MLRHWYFVSIVACPICGGEKVTRERRYGRKPKKDTREYIEAWDGCGV